MDLNSHTLAKRAGSEEKVAALGTWHSSDVFDDRERAALEYAEAITFTEQHVTDELMAKLRKYFDEDAVVELNGLIAFQNLSSKFNSALDVPSQGFCQIPPPAG